MEGAGAGRSYLDWVFLQLCSVFPRKAVIPTARKHRSKAGGGMISVWIHQSSAKESPSIPILKYFFLFHLESCYQCRNQLSSGSNSSALSSLSPAPLLHCWMSISVSFPFRTNPSFFTTGYLQLQSVPNSIGF